MDSLSSRVFILNGQPFILQQNNINSISNISGDILQHALQDVENSPSVPSQVDSDHFIQNVQSTEEDNCVDELVAFKQSNGDEQSTIHLTVKQALELGIEFNVCDVDLPSNTSFSTGDKEISIDKEQFIFSKDPSENICLFNDSNNDTSNVKDDNFNLTEHDIVSSDDISKLKLDANIIEQLNETVNPQITLVPHVHNGTITYTLQVSSKPDTDELSTNNVSSSKDSTHMLPIETTAGDSSFDLSSLTTQSLDPSTLTMPPMSLSIADTNNQSDSVAYITNSNNILSGTQNAINDNLVVYENEPLPGMIDSQMLPNKYQRFVRLSPKTNLNSDTKTSSALFVNSPTTPTVEPIPLITSVTSSQPASNRTSSANSFVLNGDQVKVQTLNIPENGNRIVPVKPFLLPKGLPKEVSKIVARFQATSDASEKVGTNKNPIQLVQQGKTFTTVQTLSSNQLRNVASVLSKNSFDLTQADPSDKNVVFDKKTNTRIIYRMVYPEDLHLKKPSSSPGDSTKKRGRPLKGTSKGDGEASPTTTTPPAPEEPPRKKVALPRTRSGRLSRPPRHIVRDYKRIRRRQSDDENSYSDYHSDDPEDQDTSADSHQIHLLPGLAETKKRRISSSFRCPKCNKVYLGFPKMENHFFKYPDHRPPATSESAPPPQAPSGVEQSRGSGGGGGGGGGGSFSKRKLKRRSLASIKPDELRAHLKQLLDLCSLTELVEVVGPVLASVLSAWQLLLLRVDAVTSSQQQSVTSSHQQSATPLHHQTVTASHPQPVTSTQHQPVTSSQHQPVTSTHNQPVTSSHHQSVMTSHQPVTSSNHLPVTSSIRAHVLCDQIKTLLASFGNLFQPVDNVDQCTLDAATFEMKDVSISSMLGIPCGTYKVDEDLLKVDKMLTHQKQPADTDSGVGGLSDAAVTHPVADVAHVASPAVITTQQQKCSKDDQVSTNEVNIVQFNSYCQHIVILSSMLSFHSISANNLK
ncbi:uncharacterized protein LOC111055157 isoform X2 [Nilaparvata lugens]|uniref:uncharacterized protein LOC111055157 isoform X2 n=1 Tax=Nilaparvata lugens TaxID=108931 RepID=UPI00193E6445|nr:uncharacterized protein LOC111055157 isoform X2 [Nilaparvata lugens]